MRRALPTALICLCALACTGGTSSKQPTLEMGAYSIARLDGCQSLGMALAMTDAFAPNVSVQTQPYPGTIEDYIALSKEQFSQVGIKLIREAKRGKSGWIVEYRGAMEGRSLHWYARAELRGKKVYLATATALETQWSSASRKLKPCVDSLQVPR
ncbi:MAG: hypothetical protein ACE149_06140 [Armatimonadota bacterium]